MTIVREGPPSPAPISSFRVIYKMEGECTWFLPDVILQGGTLAEFVFLFIMRPYHLR